MRKRGVQSIVLALTGILTIAGCSTSPKRREIPKIKIAVSAFPYYDWTMNIIKGNEDAFDVTLLYESGNDFHNFTASQKNIGDITSSKLFIYTGGISDKWAEDIATSSGTIRLRLMDVAYPDNEVTEESDVVVPVKTESDGSIDMSKYKGVDLSGKTQESEEVIQEEITKDEHIWLSLRTTQRLVKAITENICQIDPENRELYEKNLRRYITELQNLDIEFTNIVKDSPGDMILVADRMPFALLCEDYGIKYISAYPDCRSTKDITYDDARHLSEEIDKYGLQCIITLKGSNKKIAEGVRSNSLKKTQIILEMDAMHSITAGDITRGAKYLNIMRGNMETIREALK